MLIGASSHDVASRRAIHASSDHSWRDSTTTDAVAGGTSVPKAMGSAFSRQ